VASYVPPRDAYELQVAVNAGQVLAAGDDIGAFDDLSELGLTRAAAGELSDRLAALLGRRVSPATILGARTVACIAAVCRSAPKRGRWSSLVTMRGGAPGAALVFVHPIGGNAFWYLGLCRKLGGGHELYALQARGLDLTEAPHRTIEEMAAAYVAELRVARPSGPYVVLGWSFGGFVAFEMTRLLVAEDEVPLVVLFDVHPRDLGAVQPTSEAAWRLLIHAVRLDRIAGELLACPAEERADEIVRRATQLRIVPEGFTAAEIERMAELNLVHLAAMARYEPAVQAQDVLVFASAERPFLPDHDAPELGWEAFTSGAVRVHPLAGSHFDALNRANHDAITQRLRAELDVVAR
jgi:thioesterase domain-containing protein